jgi:hypothetical protein
LTVRVPKARVVAPRADAVPRHHAFHGVFDEPGRLLFADISCGLDCAPAHVPRIKVIRFPAVFTAGHPHFVGIDNDDEITSIDVGGVHRLAAATQYIGDLDSEASENFVFGVDDVPLLVDIIGLREVCFHNQLSRS